MNDKLHELTDKLYNEGLQKGLVESDELISKAKIKAAQIVADAETKATQIIEDAQKQASEERTNVETEIKLASRQVISEVKQTVENLILGKAVDSLVKDQFNNQDFVKKMILMMVERYASKENLTITVPQDQHQVLDQFIQTQIIKELSRSIEVLPDNKLKSGFKIQATNDSYYIRFSDEDFSNLFKSHLRPKVTNFLFETKD